MSVYEIYNEDIFDLLDSGDGGGGFCGDLGRNKLKLRE